MMGFAPLPPAIDLGQAAGIPGGAGTLTDGLIARRVSLVRAIGSGALASVALVWLPLVVVVPYVFLSRWLSASRWETTYARPGAGDLLEALMQYAVAAGPWTLVAALVGALLAALRCLSARRGHWWLVRLTAGQVLQFGWHSLLVGVAVPLVLLQVVFSWQPAGADGQGLQLLWVALFPFWLVSGVLVEVLWELINMPLLRRVAPLQPAVLLGLAVQSVLEAEPLLQAARIQQVVADPTTGNVTIHGVFADDLQRQRVREAGLKVAGVEQVQVVQGEAG